MHVWLNSIGPLPEPSPVPLRTQSRSRPSFNLTLTRQLHGGILARPPAWAVLGSGRRGWVSDSRCLQRRVPLRPDREDRVRSVAPLALTPLRPPLLVSPHLSHNVLTDHAACLHNVRLVGLSCSLMYVWACARLCRSQLRTIPVLNAIHGYSAADACGALPCTSGVPAARGAHGTLNATAAKRVWTTWDHPSVHAT